MEQCRRARVKVVMEAFIEVDVDYKGDLTTEQIYLLAQRKAFMSPNNDFQIENELSTEITETWNNVMGEPMNDLIKSSNNEGTIEEDIEHDMDDLLEEEFDGDAE